jgi:small subunit ribosomal protein S19
MSRSFKKGFYVHPKLAKKVAKILESGSKKVVKIWDRASQVMPDML